MSAPHPDSLPGVARLLPNIGMRFGAAVRENPQSSYYRARYYHPQLQRFIAEDPIRFNGGINFYQYVQDSPPNFIDPMGKDLGLGNRLDLPGFGGN